MTTKPLPPADIWPTAPRRGASAENIAAAAAGARAMAQSYGAFKRREKRLLDAGYTEQQIAEQKLARDEATTEQALRARAGTAAGAASGAAAAAAAKKAQYEARRAETAAAVARTQKKKKKKSRAARAAAEAARLAQEAARLANQAAPASVEAAQANTEAMKATVAASTAHQAASGPNWLLIGGVAVGIGVFVYFYTRG